MKMLAALLLLLTAGCAPSDAVATDGMTSPSLLLVGNKAENSLSFIDLDSGRELGRAETGPMPHEIALSPDGGQAAVVAYGGRTIDIFDVASRTRTRSIDLSPNEGPHGIAWLDDGRIVATAERSQSVAIVDTRNGYAVSAIRTDQQGTHMLAVSPDHRRVFTANIGSGTVSVLDLASGRKLRDLAVGGQPEGIALSPDGRTLWIGDLAGARVQAFDTATFEKSHEVATGQVPIRVVASPDGRRIVTSNFGDGSLTVIDAATGRVERTIAVSGEREAAQVTIIFSTDGSLLYVAETGRSQVAEVDLATGEVRRRFTAGRQGDGLAIAPPVTR